MSTRGASGAGGASRSQKSGSRSARGREAARRARKAKQTVATPPGRGPRSDGDAARARIIAAAERLFAERGPDAVSLVEVGRLAGQRNRSAVQYHFRDKGGLLEGIRLKHAPPIERRREAMLDALEAEGPPSLRSLVEVLVRPVADEVRNPDGGAAYVQLNAALIGHPEFSLLSRRAMLNPTADRLLRLVARTAPKLPPALVGPRIQLVTSLVFHGLADRARLAGSSRKLAGAEWELFVRNLVDAVVAVLEAPVSASTRAGLRGS